MKNHNFGISLNCIAINAEKWIIICTPVRIDSIRRGERRVTRGITFNGGIYYDIELLYIPRVVEIGSVAGDYRYCFHAWVSIIHQIMNAVCLSLRDTTMIIFNKNVSFWWVVEDWIGAAAAEGHQHLDCHHHRQRSHTVECHWDITRSKAIINSFQLVCVALVRVAHKRHTAINISYHRNRW